MSRSSGTDQLNLDPSSNLARGPVTKRKPFRKRPALTLGLIALLVAVATYGVVRHQTSSVSTNAGKKELLLVEQKVNEHYLLPTNEVPALATVTDKTKLDTTFFKRAVNGDKILIYQKNKLAIIYRPDINKIIEVGPVTFNSPGQ